MDDVKYLTVEHLSTKDLIRIFSKITVHPDLQHNNSLCWIWSASRQAKGYGHTGYAGQQIVKAHRLMFAWLIHPLPHGQKHGEIDHLCRRPSCCNPAHLELVSSEINTQRMKFLQTHCIRGHELAGNNIRAIKGHPRFCLLCEHERNKIRWATLSTEEKQAHIAKKRLWRDANKEQVHLQRRQYLDKNKDKTREYARRYRTANRELVNAKARIYGAANRELIRARARKRRKELKEQ